MITPGRAFSSTGTPEKKMYYGVYRASVVSNSDPAVQQRVTLKIPQVLGDATSNWAEAVDNASPTLPDPGTMVYAQFIGGDVNHPMYTYFKPPEQWISETPPTGFTGTLRHKIDYTTELHQVYCDLAVPATATAGTLTLISGIPADHTPILVAKGPIVYTPNGVTSVSALAALASQRWSANTNSTFTIENFAGGANNTGITTMTFIAIYPVD